MYHLRVVRLGSEDLLTAVSRPADWAQQSC